jgi:hypothetical protein
MSLDYTFFLRDQPDLAMMATRHPLVDATPHGWQFAAFRLNVYAYRPDDDDPLAGQPWRDEIRWIVSAGGRHADDDAYDAFDTFAADLCTLFRGASYCDAVDALEWHWWDRNALAAQVRPWIERGEIAELGRYLAADVLGRDGDGPREEVAAMVIAALPALARAGDTRALIAGLWTDDTLELADEPREKLGDALLAILEPTDDIADAQDELMREREEAAADAMPLPTTHAELAALYDRALVDEQAAHVMERGIANDAFVRAELGGVLLARARTGGERPRWVFSLALPQLSAAPERETASAQRAFRARGPLAAEIVDAWVAEDRYVAEVDELLERRRRAGETFAGIPDDIRALAESGKRAQAISDYAKRYELTRAVATRVIDANV